MASRNENGTKGNGNIEDAEIVPETSGSEKSGSAVSPEPAPGDGADWIDRGTVAVDVAADGPVEPETEPESRAASSEAPAADIASTPNDYDAGRTASPAAPAPRKAGGGFVPAVLGGLVAAGLGFGAAYYLDPTFGSPDPVEQQLASQSDRMAALEDQISGIADAVTSSAPLEDLSGRIAGRLDDIDSRLEEVSGGVAQLGDRLAAVEQRPLTESSETARQAFQSYEQQLEDLRATLAEQQDLNAQLTQELENATAAAEERVTEVQNQAQNVQQQAEAEARRAAVQATIARIEAALDRGAPYSDALSDLPEDVEVPEPLSANAETGAATLAGLRDRFPSAAREALDASIKQTVDDSPTGRFAAFLRSQTGARSLAPREGDDPDAVLSRAEAAVTNGNLQAAIDELANLPEDGQAAMSEWIAQAQTRVEVVKAADALSAGVQGE